MFQSLIYRFRNRFNNKSLEPNNAIIGKRGETLAANYLKKEKGYKLIARNWRNKNDEIDIIAQDGEVLVFLEVKTSSTDALVPAYYRVTTKKKRILERACKSYLKSRSLKKKHFRFDIIAVKLCQMGENSIEHYVNVKLFSKNFHTLRDE